MKCLILRISYTCLFLSLVAGLKAQSLAEPNAITQFRFPALGRFTYRRDPAPPPAPALAAPAAGATQPPQVQATVPPSEWIEAVSESHPELTYYFGSRVVLKLTQGIPLDPFLAKHSLTLARTLQDNLFILQSASASAALTAAQHLSSEAGVIAAYPVYTRPADLNFAYAPAPNDEFFAASFANVVGQWYLEDRDPETAAPLGVDLNARGAWSGSRGAGVTVAIADIGVDLNHPDLRDRTAGAPHRNFILKTSDGNPVKRSGESAAHGTGCAGLVAATANNHLAMTGIAPESQIASWIIVDPSGRTASNEALMDMFGSNLETVAVQNHSWGLPGKTQLSPSILEETALDRAFVEGRGGRGVVMVRAAGNGRALGQDANDNGYANDPRAIAVGAVQRNGRSTTYSAPGACLLVSAPGGSLEEGGLFCTDLTGGDGANVISFFPPFDYLSDFRWGRIGFIGTSASAPLISGIAALTLSANPSLTVRDIQQILLLSARQHNLGDPDLRANGAGLLTSHNTGYGVVDAGEAVRLAQTWSNRPPAITVVDVRENLRLDIPDDGLRLETSGTDVPASFQSVRTIPGTGPFADAPTRSLPLVPVQSFGAGDSINLTNSGALIEWQQGQAVQQINFAAAHGAEFAVIYNCSTNGSTPCSLGSGLPLSGTDFTAIPAVFIGRSAGLGLIDVYQTNRTALTRIHLQSVEVPFEVTRALSVEHVQLRIKTDHTLRGDVRITLISPSGTKSVLQKLNDDTTPGPVDWTYSSTRHFYESSQGTWRLALSDLSPESTGALRFCSLSLTGVEVEDVDADGLDDRWERQFFGNLSHGPKEDLASDGYSLIRKFVAGWNPLVKAHPLALDITRWNDHLARVSWPGLNRPYQLLSDSKLSPLVESTPVAGTFPETVWFVPLTNAAQYFRLNLP